jgi:predicted permease
VYLIDILNIVLPTFLVILVGFLFGKIKRIDMSAVVEVAIYIGMPALAFTSMLDKDIVLLDASKVWASAVIIILGCGILAWVIFKLLRQKHSGLFVSIAMMNSVNIPFPITYLAFGSEGLFAAVLFYIPQVLLAYTLGIFIMAGQHWKENLKEVFKIPPIYGAVLGLVLNLAGVNVPDLVIRPLSVIGSMVIPLVLLVLGYNLSRVKISSVPTTLLASFLRVGVGLGLGFLTSGIFGLTGVLRAVVILDSAMPAAATASILATKYNNEAELVSSVVFVTTVTSLVVIPFLLSILT